MNGAKSGNKRNQRNESNREHVVQERVVDVECSSEAVDLGEGRRGTNELAGRDRANFWRAEAVRTRFPPLCAHWSPSLTTDDSDLLGQAGRMSKEDDLGVKDGRQRQEQCAFDRHSSAPPFVRPP